MFNTPIIHLGRDNLKGIYTPANNYDPQTLSLSLSLSVDFFSFSRALKLYL